MAGYRWDRANDPDAGMPLAVVRAGSTEDVQAAVRFAAEHGLPYHHNGSFFEAVVVHARTLRRLGNGEGLESFERDHVLAASAAAAAEAAGAEPAPAE